MLGSYKLTAFARYVDFEQLKFRLRLRPEAIAGTKGIIGSSALGKTSEQPVSPSSVATLEQPLHTHTQSQYLKERTTNQMILQKNQNTKSNISLDIDTFASCLQVLWTNHIL